MTHFQIQQIVSQQTSEMKARQKTELRDLRTKWEEDRTELTSKHKQESLDLQASHMELYREYREKPGEASSRVADHNRELQRKTMPDKLRQRYNIEADTDEEFIEKLKERLKEMTKTYQNVKGFPAEARRLERGEDELRAAIRILGGSIADVPFISANSGCSADVIVDQKNIDDILAYN